ncbi:MAG: hypothetical protein AAGI53_08960 [Planctomycetota bacterium]
MSFRVHVNPSSIRPAASDPVGEIWVSMDGAAFPGERYTDFVVRSLVSWAAPVGAAVAKRITWRFFDDPHLIRFQDSDGGLNAVGCREDSQRPLASCETTWTEVRTELAAAARSVAHSPAVAPADGQALLAIADAASTW